MADVTLHLGDCLEIMPTLAAESVDSIVCDPPYGLNFMSRDWDHGVPGEHFWREALRVAKPGAMLLAFGGTRTFHRLACAIEDAGWELRDTVMWVYGSGFPKSADVSKPLDKQAGAEREVVGQNPTYRKMQEQAANYNLQRNEQITAPATPAAAQWQGWGTALKPAWEPIIMARKPLERGLTVAGNVLKWGVGCINVDGCRVEAEPELAKNWQRIQSIAAQEGRNAMNGGLSAIDLRGYAPSGRWPANLIHDGSDEVLAGFPVTTSGNPNGAKRNVSGPFLAHANGMDLSGYGDTGSAARFFYCAKASKRDRDEGCEGLEERHSPHGNYEGRDMGNPKNHLGGLQGTRARNHHPTVKPTALMRYLVRLVTPPGGLVLDPFMGSGSTGKAALIEGFRFVGIEQDAEYLEIARRRIAYVERQRLHNVEQLPSWVGDVWEHKESV